MRLLEEGRIPKTPVFVNSVIASKVISVYGKLFKSSEGGDTLSDFALKKLDIYLKK